MAERCKICGSEPMEGETHGTIEASDSPDRVAFTCLIRTDNQTSPNRYFQPAPKDVKQADHFWYCANRITH